MSESAGDWAKAKRKIREGKNWRGTANVQLGDVQAELGFRLLTEDEFLELQADIDKEALREYRGEEETDAERRLMELQEKDELDDDEKAELEEVTREVESQRAGIADALGKKTFDAFLQAGEEAIMPTDDDIEDAFDATPDEQEERFGTIPNTRSEMEESLKREMQDVVADSPYLVRFTLGQQAFAESAKLLGNETTDGSANE